ANFIHAVFLELKFFRFGELEFDFISAPLLFTSILSGGSFTKCLIKDSQSRFGKAVYQRLKYSMSRLVRVGKITLQRKIDIERTTRTDSIDQIESIAAL